MNADELRQWRHARGLSQAALARRLGVPVRSYQQWESGRRPVPPWLEPFLDCLDRAATAPKPAGV